VKYVVLEDNSIAIPKSIDGIHITLLHIDPVWAFVLIILSMVHRNGRTESHVTGCIKK
jgi:hypothetical protein